MKKLFTVFSFLSITLILPAQIQTVAEVIQPLDLKYKYSFEIEEDLDTNQQPWKYQNAATNYSFIGNDESVFRHFYRDYPVRKPMSDHELDSFMNLYHLVDAVEYILKQSQSEQVVIINEAHHKPKHRVFTRSLLQGLYDQGFRHLGLEALSNIMVSDSSLNERKVPHFSTGYYIMESQFGNLVREALDIGYTLFPYEGEGNGKPREINQAKNITAFMEKHPGEKILIHCGYQHAQEGAIKGWEKAMAGRLMEYTGINPLTINQTIYDNRYDTSYMSPLHQRLNLTKPMVLLDSNEMSFLGTSDTSGFDIVVFHEKNRKTHGRNTWLQYSGNQWVKISLEDLKMDKPYFILAYPEGNDVSKAIPVDMLELEPKTKNCHLVLKPGKYRVIAQSPVRAMGFNLSVE